MSILGCLEMLLMCFNKILKCFGNMNDNASTLNDRSYSELTFMDQVKHSKRFKDSRGKDSWKRRNWMWISCKKSKFLESPLSFLDLGYASGVCINLLSIKKWQCKLLLRELENRKLATNFFFFFFEGLYF